MSALVGYVARGRTLSGHGSFLLSLLFIVPAFLGTIVRVVESGASTLCEMRESGILFCMNQLRIPLYLSQLMMVKPLEADWLVFPGGTAG